MESCDCPHDAGTHAPVAEFGASMCLAPDCDCEGTKAQVAAMVAERVRRSPQGKLDRLVEIIANVLRNPYPRTVDDSARNIAQAIVGNFDLEER